MKNIQRDSVHLEHRLHREKNIKAQLFEPDRTGGWTSKRPN